MTRFGITLLLLVPVAWISAQVPRAPMPVQMPPIPPSPIEEFRNWLKMPAEEREQELSAYTEPKRAVLREKLRSYEAMPADRRERLLRMLELRWYLRPLMEAPPEQRTNSLSMIPTRLHDLVRSRLQTWDQLESSVRQEILADDKARELATGYFVHIRRSPSAAADLHPLSEAKRKELSEALERWRQSSESHRAKMAGHLSAFFELPRTEQDKALGRLSDAERQDMQKTLDSFARLTPESRRVCVNSFHKFATMTPQERAGFLRNAAKWQQMTPQERETWKKLVTKLPPMPSEPPVRPPMPRPEVRLPRADVTTAGTSY